MLSTPLKITVSDNKHLKPLLIRLHQQSIHHLKIKHPNETEFNIS